MKEVIFRLFVESSIVLLYALISLLFVYVVSAVEARTGRKNRKGASMRNITNEVGKLPRIRYRFSEN